jgi:hypothetical protein
MTEDEVKKYLEEKQKTCEHSPVYIGNSEKWSVVMCKLCGKNMTEELTE